MDMILEQIKMKNVIYLYAFLVSIFLVSCQTPAFVCGVYRNNQSDEFIFHPDSTFTYKYHGFWYKESSGLWTLTGNLLYINSTLQQNKFLIKYNTKDAQQHVATTVNIEIDAPDEHRNDYFCYPIINGKLVVAYPVKRGNYSIQYAADINKISFLISKHPSVFSFRGTGIKMCYDDIETETIYPHISTGGVLDVNIRIVDSLFGYKVFNNSRLRIKKNKVIFDHYDNIRLLIRHKKKTEILRKIHVKRGKVFVLKTKE
jgi:hypothetical protein